MQTTKADNIPKYQTDADIRTVLELSKDRQARQTMMRLRGGTNELIIETGRCPITNRCSYFVLRLLCGFVGLLCEYASGVVRNYWLMSARTSVSDNFNALPRAGCTRVLAP